MIKSRFAARLALASTMMALSLPSTASATSFNFDWSGGDLQFSGTFIADQINPTSYHVTGISGTMTSTSLGNGVITGMNTTFLDPDNIIDFSRASIVDYSGLSFNTDNGPAARFNFADDGGGASYAIYSPSYNATSEWGSGAFTFSAAGAPEIDGGKLPLAALLLGLVAVIAQRKRKALLAA